MPSVRASSFFRHLNFVVRASTVRRPPSAVRRIGFLTLFLPAFLALPATAQVQVNRKHSETVLSPYSPEAKDLALITPEVMSPDGRHLAYVKGLGKSTPVRIARPGKRPLEKKAYEQYQVVVDGKEQKVYNKVDGLIYSPDSQWLAYAASTGEDQWRVVVNAREEAQYKRVGMPVFSPDSKRLAYVALGADNSRFVVVNGKAGRPYDKILPGGQIFFSPDGQHMAYGARRKENDVAQWYAVIDDKESPPLLFLGTATGIQFSSDGGRVAYAAMAEANGTAWNVIVDGQKQKIYQNIGDLAFSPDGKRLAYVAQQKDGKWRLSVDGSEQKPYDTIAAGTLQFSPDGKYVAYAARLGEKWLIVVNNHEGKAYDGASDMVFSPNSKYLASIVQLGTTEMVVLNLLEKNMFQEQAIFDRIGGGTLVFSPDSNRLGYIGRAGSKSFVVIASASVAKRGSSRQNRKRGYDMVGYLNFTPDSDHYVFAATSGDKAFTVVDDQEAAHRYQSIWNIQGTRLLFDSRKKFHYLAAKEGSVYLVEEELD
jgi:Tol biopolymer transport system component